MARRGRSSPSYVGLTPASEAASRAGKGNRGTDTGPEVLLRREVWKLGLRYRKHAALLPGKPDLVFPAARLAVFCDGDFWHGRHWRKLRAQLARRHNADYWVAKIQRNRGRDRENTAQLKRLGWAVLRLWETDIRRSPAEAAALVRDAVQARREGAAPPRPGPGRP
jgi:DNA mismatch endonuclease (patch repair protein)